MNTVYPISKWWNRCHVRHFFVFNWTLCKLHETRNEWGMENRWIVIKSIDVNSHANCDECAPSVIQFFLSLSFRFIGDVKIERSEPSAHTQTQKWTKMLIESFGKIMFSTYMCIWSSQAMASTQFHISYCNQSVIKTLLMYGNLKPRSIG